MDDESDHSFKEFLWLRKSVKKRWLERKKEESVAITCEYLFLKTNY